MAERSWSKLYPSKAEALVTNLDEPAQNSPITSLTSEWLQDLARCLTPDKIIAVMSISDRKKFNSENTKWFFSNFRGRINCLLGVEGSIFHQLMSLYPYNPKVNKVAEDISGISWLRKCKQNALAGILDRKKNISGSQNVMVN